jgi:hypothetical protein
VSADFPDGTGPADPSLDGLLRALTADGSADELAGRAAALATFRRSRRRPRRRSAFSVSTAAAALVLAGGIAAAYAAVLPTPVQHIAFRMLDGIGVPDAHHPRPSSSTPPATTSIPSTTSHTAAAASPTAARRGQTGTRGANTAPALVLTAAQAQIPADEDDVLSGRLVRGGRAEPGVRVLLLERVGGLPGWQAAGSAVTDRRGDVTLIVRQLTSNASFRLTAPGGAASRPVFVTVIPPVYLDVTAGKKPGTDVLTATAPFADTGDVVVLQELSGGRWHSVRRHLLDAEHQASFTVRIPGSGDLVYRVVLRRTSFHGPSASGQVWIAATSGPVPAPTRPPATRTSQPALP